MNAHIIAIAHHAGGVGKTTTALSLGYTLAATGARMLVVDMDPNADLSTRLQVGASTPLLATVLLDGAGTPYRERLRWGDVTLDVMPSDGSSMTGVGLGLVPLQQRESRLQWILDPLRADYDYILIDCPPSTELVAVAAFYAADSLLIPVQAQDKAVRQLDPLHAALALVHKYRRPVGVPAILGYLATMVDSRTLQSREAVADLRATYGDLVFQTVIPTHATLQSDSRYQAPVGVYDRGGRSATAYADLAQEVIKRATP